MLHTITKKIEICIVINIKISEVNHYTWIFTSRIFRLALEIYIFLNKYFSVLMAYELLSQSRKLKRREVLVRAEGLENFLKKKKINGGTLIWDPRVIPDSRTKNSS